LFPEKMGDKCAVTLAVILDVICVICIILLVTSLASPWYYQYYHGDNLTMQQEKSLFGVDVSVDCYSFFCSTGAVAQIFPGLTTGFHSWEESCEVQHSDCSSQKGLYTGLCLVNLAGMAVLIFLVMILSWSIIAIKRDRRVVAIKLLRVIVPLAFFLAFLLIFLSALIFPLTVPSAMDSDNECTDYATYETPCWNTFGKAYYYVYYHNVVVEWGPTTGWIVTLVAAILLFIAAIMSACLAISARAGSAPTPTEDPSMFVPQATFDYYPVANNDQVAPGLNINNGSFVY